MHYRGGRAGPRILGNLGVEEAKDAIRLSSPNTNTSTCSTPEANPDHGSDSEEEEVEKDQYHTFRGNQEDDQTHFDRSNYF